MFTYVYVFAIVPIPLKELRANNHFREGFRGVIKDSAVSIRLWKQLPRSISDHGSGFGGLYQTAEAAFSVSIISQKPYISNNYLNFLGEFEAIFETALAHESGP
jgi:hypothetical protein